MAKAGTKDTRLIEIAENNFVHAESSSFRNYEEAEALYLQSANSEHRKRFAQFFTPQEIAELMCKWIQEVSPKTILDPAVGVGVFPSILVKKIPDAKITAFEVDKNVLSYARTLLQDKSVDFRHQDFLLADDATLFDAAISNPPYLKHHNFFYEENIFEIIGKRNGVKLSKLTNIYGLFILEICRRLKDGGRAAIIVPTEWTNSNFGQAIKKFLIQNGILASFLYYSHESLPFADALTTACVLFLEKAKNKLDKKVRTIYLESQVSSEIIWEMVNGRISQTDGAVYNEISGSDLLAAKKWDYILRSADVAPVRGTVPLRSFAKTKRGIATGANEFFHLSLTDAMKFGIQKIHLHPCVGKAKDVVGLCFTEEDLEGLVSQGKSTHLMCLATDISKSEKAYLDYGESIDLHKRYLLAARKNWYSMEDRPAAPIWAAVFGRQGLRFVRNKTNSLNLTAFHCIYPADSRPIFLDALTVCLNSNLIQELSRREHRVYGGGLLKVEPKDLLDIHLPDLSKATDIQLAELASYIEVMDQTFRKNMSLPMKVQQEIDVCLKNLMNNDCFSVVEDHGSQSSLF